MKFSFTHVWILVGVVFVGLAQAAVLLRAHGSSVIVLSSRHPHTGPISLPLFLVPWAFDYYYFFKGSVSTWSQTHDPPTSTYQVVKLQIYAIMADFICFHS